MPKCLSCFNDYAGAFNYCPFCGAPKRGEPLEAVHLYPGTVLAGRYLIGYSIGQGGFGIIYKAYDMKLEIVVAVKEFFASKIVTRAPGTPGVIVGKKSREEFDYRKGRFLAEARNMAKFGDHRSIPHVFEFFEENGTAYIVMELLTGQPLNEYLKSQNGPVNPDFALYIANEVGHALESLHSEKIIHRDVAPDNIFICTGETLRIILLDLGAAKLADTTDDVIDVILKPGYSPVEQYDNGRGIGPWSDIYALGATLYVMLTGVHPDESTNRKIKDNVPPPSEINPSIPENLSNAVMKAMAINRHMRFATVGEFLRAINGEKKVVPLAREKKIRWGRRFAGIAAAFAVLVTSGILVFNLYNHKKNGELLPDAAIEIWFCEEETRDFEEEASLKSIAEDFHGKFPNVEVTVRGIPERDYEETLRDAATAGKLPALFESTPLPDSVLRGARDLDAVLSSDQAKSCLFLDQYEAYYTGKKRLPLAVEAPIAYTITAGPVKTDYSESTFTSPEDFAGDTVAFDGRYRPLLQKNFRVSGGAGEKDFLNPESNTAAVLISSTLALNDVRALTAYGKSYVFPAGDAVYCDFTYEWSVGGGSEEEAAAAERLLSWMLGNAYQTTLMITSGISEGQYSKVPANIPVNGTAFRQKAKTVPEFSGLINVYSKFVFEEE